METGATEAGMTGLAGHLLLQWDGVRLQWLVGTGRVVHNFGESPAKDPKELEFVCRELHGKGLTADQVVWSQRFPSFSLWPAVLVGEDAEAAFRLEHNGQDAGGVKKFLTSSLGEEMFVIEPGLTGVEALFVSVWPQARRVSSIIAFLEAAIRQDAALGASSICIDVGQRRALMLQTKGKSLKLAQIMPFTDPEGLLYHVVNALHRNGLEPATCGAVVRWSGEIQKDGTRWKLFSRFFPEMEILSGFRAMDWGEHDVRRERWTSLTNLTACV